MSRLKRVMVAAAVMAASLVGMQGVAHAAPSAIYYGCGAGSGGTVTFNVNTSANTVIADSGGSNHYYLTLGKDGNLVRFHDYSGNHIVDWQTYTANTGVNRLVFQSDGNIVLYRPIPYTPLVAWASNIYDNTCSSWRMRQSGDNWVDEYSGGSWAVQGLW